jgi:phenol/toluene 2-monooxygenase (NADH) P5/A5
VATSLSGPSPEPAPKHTQRAYEAVVERIFEHTVDTRSLFLRLPVKQSLSFQPGQFLSFALPVNEQVLTRPYSIASDSENGNLLEICFNLVPNGLGSRYLFERRMGDTLRFTGPWGTFVLDQTDQSESIFIAEGPGIAPIRPMIKRMLISNSGSSVQLLYWGRTRRELLYYSEWESRVQSSGRFRFMPSLADPSGEWKGLRGSLMELVARAYIQADNDRSRCFYICGVGRQVITLRDVLRQAGYQRQAVHYEKW